MLSETVYPIMPGDTVFMHAAASGVGYYLVQLAKQRGAKVIGTTSSAEKAQAVIEASEAHRRIEGRTVQGKLVLRP